MIHKFLANWKSPSDKPITRGIWGFVQSLLTQSWDPSRGHWTIWPLNRGCKPDVHKRCYYSDILWYSIEIYSNILYINHSQNDAWIEQFAQPLAIDFFRLQFGGRMVIGWCLHGARKITTADIRRNFPANLLGPKLTWKHREPFGEACRREPGSKL